MFSKYYNWVVFTIEVSSVKMKAGCCLCLVYLDECTRGPTVWHEFLALLYCICFDSVFYLYCGLCGSVVIMSGLCNSMYIIHTLFWKSRCLVSFCSYNCSVIVTKEFQHIIGTGTAVQNYQINLASPSLWEVSPTFVLATAVARLWTGWLTFLFPQQVFPVVRRATLIYTTLGFLELMWRSQVCQTDHIVGFNHQLCIVITSILYTSLTDQHHMPCQTETFQGSLTDLCLYHASSNWNLYWWR